MELDVDSVLRRHSAAGISTVSSSSSDEDTDDPSLPRRTVDDILNDSDTSSSPSPRSPVASSSPTSYFSRHHRDATTSIATLKDEPLRSDCPREDDAYSVITAASETQSLAGVTRTLKLRQDSAELDGRLDVPKYTSVQRLSSDDLSVFTSKRPRPTSSVSTRPLGSLFGGVRSSAKPGAALAAAAAASRSVLTPHAAAIKSRRAMSVSLDRKLSEGDQLFSSGNSFSVGIDRASTSSSGHSNAKLELEDDRMGEFQTASLEEKVNLRQDAQSDDTVVEMRENGATDALEGDAKSEKVHFPEDETREENQEDALPKFNAETTLERENVSLDDNVAVQATSEQIASTSYGDWDVVDHNDPKLADVHHFSTDTDGIHSVSEDVKSVEEDSDTRTAEPPDGEKDDSLSNVEETSSITEDVTKLVEDRLAQLESERSSKKADDKMRPPKKPLELAEDFEKKQASTGLHLEEGAAAQPMRLEGVRRGSTVLGYFDIDADNMATRNLSSQEFRLDQGSAQVLAVHHNYIAVGMSKGAVVVVPSKYSVYHPDSMDAKMLILGQQADRPQAPVTSICFNLQGDLLLAGYGDGLVVFWDVQKAVAVKVISGEHKAPVVHAFFLGQDPQVSRAFKAITGDGKGLVLLHTISVMPFIGRFTVETQCCLDGQRTGTVLCAVPLLADGLGGASSASSQGNVSTSSSNIGGKVVGGVVGGYSAWKLFTEVPSLSEEGVVIFVTHKTALVVRLSPSLEVYAQVSRPEGVREGSMPYAAWKCTTQCCGSSTDNLPVEASEKISLLAIAWDRKVQVAKLVKSDLKFFGKWTLESAAIGLTWLDDQMLVVFTLTGQLCLFARDGTLIHQTSYTTDRFGEDLIAYHTYFSNIFGNPEKSYHNSVAARGASVYILGPMHLAVCRLLPWKERIQVLRKAGDWMGALNMAISLYDGHSHGVIDLPRSVHAVQQAIMPYLVELLFSYVDEVFSYISVACTSQIGKLEDVDGSQSMSSSMQSEIKEQFTRVGGVAVEFCVHIRRTDILFDEVFSKFVAIHHRDTFLELLEPYILKDMLGSLPPEIMQALVEHYNHKGWLQRVEQCVLHMDISSLDFNQVVRLCQEHGLYGALIYLFNKGLDDFKTPLEELLTVLRTSEGDNVTALGYRMLVYLKYCFLGLAFPPGHGTLDPSRVPSLRVELLQFLLQKSAVPKSRPVASLIPAGSYINLYYLLELDTEATLEVLRCGFLEDEFSHPREPDNDSSDTVLEAAHSNLPVENQNSLLQSIIDALVDVLLIDISEGARSSGSDETGCRVWPSRHDIGLVIEFIAGYVACRRAVVLKSVLSQIFEYLTSQNNDRSEDSGLINEYVKRNEKQVLSLLNVVPETDWNASYVLHLCEKAEFYQVCGLIHCSRHQYLAALDSYMKDVDEPIHAFSFINDTLLHPQEIDVAAFRSAVTSRIPKLTILSRECTFLLVIDHFRDESEHILSELRAHPRSLFLYLKTLNEAHLSGTLNFSYLRNRCTADEQGVKQSDVQRFRLGAYLERVSEFPKLLRNNPVEITDDIIEIYVELLCQFEPDSVLKFLETFESYRVENCLRLCQKYDIVDGAAFLLERVGDVGTALQLTLSGINEKFMLLDAAVGNLVSGASADKVAKIDVSKIMSELKEVQDIIKVLRACVGLCQRNTPRLDPEESEILWFQLLDSFCKPLMYEEQDKVVRTRFPGFKDEGEEGILVTWRIAKTERSASVLKRLFAQFVKEIVEGMIRYVRPSSIMSKLLTDNGSQEFGDFKLTILGMLGTYGFERRILDTAMSLIEDDTFYTMSVLKKGASHGYAPRSLLCCVCNCPFNKTSSVRVFQCGHATHSQCQHQEDEKPSQNSSSGCPICMPKKKTQPKSKVMELGLVNRSPSRPVHTQGTSSSVQHAHEIDVLESSRANHQISRFDILANLRKNPRMIQIESLPQLRLAPPALYYEKVKKSSRHTAGSSSLAEEQKPTGSRSKQLREIKTSGSSLRFPLKSRIFGKEKSRAV